MDENKLIETISTIVGKEFIGDDCAYLKDLGIVITQDSLVEDIHFKRNWITPEQLGYKSIAVNISDILASGAEPYAVTVALSLPKDIKELFVKEFYMGAVKALNGAKIIGGDITGSNDKIFISVCAIGKTDDRKISSRKNAKIGDMIITSGKFGSSARGLKELIQGKLSGEFIYSHLEPKLNYNLSKTIAENINCDYAMMDTSDGLADALFKIAKESGVKLVVNYDNIPHEETITKKEVLFGGEDYNLVAVLPEDFVKTLKDASIIGRAETFDGYYLDISGEKFNEYSQLKVYNHFGENNG